MTPLRLLHNINVLGNCNTFASLLKESTIMFAYLGTNTHVHTRTHIHRWYERPGRAPKSQETSGDPVAGALDELEMFIQVCLSKL